MGSAATILFAKKIEIFSQLRRGQLEAVVALMRRVHYTAGTVVYRQGEWGERFYVVIRGELSMWRVGAGGKDVEVGRASEGQTFAQRALFVAGPYAETAIALTDADLYYIEQAEFKTLLDQQPRLIERLVIAPEVSRLRRLPRYDWLDADEMVIYQSRKSKYSLWTSLLTPILLVALLVIITGSLAALTASSPPVPLLLLVVGSLLLLAPVALAAWYVMDWWNDVYVVTTKRVLHEEKRPFIRVQRVETSLHNIQDVQQTHEGFLHGIFDIGNLVIATAGGKGQIVFREIERPGEARQIVFAEVQRLAAQARADSLSAIRDSLRDRLREPAKPLTTGPAAGQDTADDAAGIRLQKLLGGVLPRLRYVDGDTITWRKHWIVLLEESWAPSLLIVFVTLAMVAWPIVNPDLLLAGTGVYAALMLVLVPWWIYHYQDWHNDVYQVNRLQIIDIERLPFLLREVRHEASLERVQNINVESSGILNRLLKVGNVYIETAGETGRLDFIGVHKPLEVQKEIFQRVETLRKARQKEESEQTRNQLLDWFAVYQELQAPGTGEYEGGPAESTPAGV